MKPKATMASVESSTLDREILKRIKQHNRKFQEKKNQDAVALRKRLEEWKEEKKKKKKQDGHTEQKKRFVTTVLKPVPSKPLDVTRNKPSVQHKPVKVSSKVVCKATLRQPTSKPGQNVRQKENQKPAAGITKRKLSTTIISRLTDRPKKTATNTARPPPLKRPAPDTTTPLSGNTRGLGKRHAIANFSKEGEEMVRPVSLAEELQSAVGSLQAEASDGVPTLFQPSADLSTTAEGKLGDLTTSRIEGSGNRDSDSTSVSLTKTRSRDSLTSRFRKSKHPSTIPAKKGSAGSASKTSRSSSKMSGSKASRHSAHGTRVSVSKPRKSILKRSSMNVSPSSRMGASPVLPSKGKNLTSLKDKPASASGKPAEGKSLGTPALGSACGHVAFTPNAGKKGEGAHYRKTPGKTKTQEFMRSKLDEWLAAKGRTPLHLRHSACFHGEGEGSQRSMPRAQIKASMSVEQLSRQERALAKEEDMQSIRKRLEWTGRKQGRPITTRRSSPSAMTTVDRRKTFIKRSDAKEGMDKEGAGPSSGSPGGVRFHGEESFDVIEKEVGVNGRKRPSWSAVGADCGSPQDLLDVSCTSTEQLQAECQKCLTALQSGELSGEVALEWLDLMGGASREVWRHAPWYACRVAALREIGDEDRILAAFEEAIIHGAQPAKDMAKLLTTTMRELLADQTASRPARNSTSTARKTPSVRRAQQTGQVVEDMQAQNMFESTVVRFSVSEVTPFKKKRRVTDTEERLVSVVTPVRRSTRLSSSAARPSSVGKGRLPHPGAPHVAEYSALEEVPNKTKENMLFFPNHALDALMSDISPV